MAKSLKEQLKDMQAKIEKTAKNILKDEVFDEVKKIGRDSVQTHVYDAYPDPVYKRTNQLRDTAWEVHETKDGVIVRSNRTETSRKTGKIFQISHVVESGEGYTFPDTNVPPKYGKPRPFMEETVKEIERTDIVSKTLADELEDELGIKCKFTK